MASYLRASRDGVELLILVQPRASRTRVVGEHDGRLKIQISSPPVDGAANETLLTYLAELLSLARRSLRIGAGQTGRRKTVIAEGLSVAHAAQALGCAT